MTKAESLLHRIHCNITYACAFRGVLAEVGYDPVADRMRFRCISKRSPDDILDWPPHVIHVGYVKQGSRYEDLVSALTKILANLEEV